jgi:hypothetical protein
MARGLLSWVSTMSKHPMGPDPELPTLDAEELRCVTGGATVEDALSSLLSSIKDLASSQQSSGGGMSEMLPMMMMMMKNQGPPAPAEPPIGQVTANGWTRVS